MGNHGLVSYHVISSHDGRIDDSRNSKISEARIALFGDQDVSLSMSGISNVAAFDNFNLLPE